MELTDKQLKDLKNVLKIQGSPGNWDYDDYMRGMYNGIELMMAIIENRDPVYRDEAVDEVSSTSSGEQDASQ